METDELLLKRVRGGDIAAFDVLYDRYEARLFAYLRALLGDRRDAEEILHDALMATLRQAPESLEPGGFRAWVYRVARNLALNRKRAAGRRDRSIAELVESGAHEIIENAERMLEARELDAALVAAVSRLPEGLSELYHLRTSGLSYEEIADVVDAPIGTVKSRMFQMVRTLREELHPWIAPK